MKIESLRIKNFKAFKDVKMDAIPDFCVIVGANGAGKSTFFSFFEFLKDIFTTSVNEAINKIGGGRGFKEVRSRGTIGPIEIEISFKKKTEKKLYIYSLIIDEEKTNTKTYIKSEKMTYSISPSKEEITIFENNKGELKIFELSNFNVDNQQLFKQPLKSFDISAVKPYGQFKALPGVNMISSFIENQFLSDIQINKTKSIQISGNAEHLSKEGENLSLVLQYYYENHREIFNQILESLSERIPGISKIEAKTTEEGRVLLKFKDQSFEDPFLSQYISDGTIKMLAYLVLLYDPNPYPLLCVEEPENQLYQSLLYELAEEFRSYTLKGSQVFVSTHSPDFLNAAKVDEVFWLEKKYGYTTIVRANQNKQIVDYMNEGDQMGYLWKQGFFGSVDPE